MNFDYDRDRREERRQYENDVFYEVWRSGGNPDRIDYERVDNAFYDGRRPEDAASSELRAQRPAPQYEEQYEEQRPEDMP